MQGVQICGPSSPPLVRPLVRPPVRPLVRPLCFGQVSLQTVAQRAHIYILKIWLKTTNTFYNINMCALRHLLLGTLTKT